MSLLQPRPCHCCGARVHRHAYRVAGMRLLLCSACADLPQRVVAERCASHVDDRLEDRRARGRRRYAMRRDAGLCVELGCNDPLASGSVRCARHLELVNGYRRRRAAA